MKVAAPDGRGLRFTDIEFRMFGQLLRSHCGLHFAEDLRYLLEKRVARRVESLGLGSFASYHYLLRHDREGDEELARLSEAMFKLMYDTDGVGLAAPQVGVNYRMMVYNEAGEPGKGKEVTLVNPKIVKFAKQKDLFEEGCLSFPKIYAEVEVRRPKTTPERFTPRPRTFLFPPLRTERKPVSAYNKYTLIPAALVVGCRKAMSKPHARLPPVQMTRGSRSRDVSPDPTPQTLNLLLDPLFPFSDRWACRSRRRTCAGRSSR